MVQLGFYQDSTKCIGCRACMMACKDKSDSPVEVDLRKVTASEGGKFPNPWLYFISMSCNHCGNAKCVTACPYGATSKRKSDGLVVVDKKMCTGCGTCVAACPYEARTVNTRETKIAKCDGCIDFLLNAQNGGKPQCVNACGVRCLDFGDIESLKMKYSSISGVKALPDSSETNPSFLVTPTIYGRK